MRCSKCGKKIRKKSNFCIKCGAKIPPTPKKDKEKTKKKKRPLFKIIIPAVLFLIIGLMAFLIFGGDSVPGKIKNLKGYSYLSGIANEKLPDRFQLPTALPWDLSFELPFEFPWDFSFKLPFELPQLLGNDDIADKEEAKEETAGSEGKEENPGLNLENGENGTDNTEGEKTSLVGVDNDSVVSDKLLLSDTHTDWKQSKVKVLKHNTDEGTGTDTVVVLMELKNDYVNMTGTKEIVYHYNEQTGEWEPGSVSKITCLSMEPSGRE